MIQNIDRYGWNNSGGSQCPDAWEFVLNPMRPSGHYVLVGTTWERNGNDGTCVGPDCSHLQSLGFFLCRFEWQATHRYEPFNPAPYLSRLATCVQAGCVLMQPVPSQPESICVDGTWYQLMYAAIPGGVGVEATVLELPQARCRASCRADLYALMPDVIRRYRDEALKDKGKACSGEGKVLY